MVKLFEKAVVFTDIHLGLKSNSELHNQDCVDFVKWMVLKGKEHKCDSCIFMGDFHNNRSSINIMTLNHSVRVLEMLSENFDKIYFIPGNHDIFFKDKRDIQSITWAKHIKNVIIINEITTLHDVTFVPWLVKEEFKKLKTISSKYMFGHFELPNYYMNSMVKMPEHGEFNETYLQKIEKVFSGHFHKRQSSGNVTYIGNCFPHNFGDANDDDRGCMILGWNEEPEYYAWPHQPKYRIYKLSELVNDPENLLKPKMYVKVHIDFPITYEESLYIREQLIEQYNLREFTLIPQKTEIQNSETTSLTFKSVDQIVSEEIGKITSEQFNTSTLLDIYQKL